MPRSILLIDDEFPLLTAWQFRLSASGYDVQTASSGAAGLQAVKDKQPDLILLDIRMPEMDGFEVCRQLKADPETTAIPVVFMSANVQEEARRTAADVGAAGFLSKPLDSDLVLNTIASTLGADANKCL